MSRRAVVLRRGLPPAPGISAPTDRRFRRFDVRPAARRWPATIVRRVALPIAMAAVVVLAGRLAWHALVTSPALAVREVAVHGNVRLSSGEIFGLVDGLRRENILTVNLETYRQRLLGSTWVASATLRRELPSSVSIDIVERTPLAIGRSGSQLYLMDAGGAPIDEFGPPYRDLDLPIVDGLVPAPGTAADRDGDAARARVTQRLIEALRTAPDLRVSQIDVSNARDVVVVLGGETTALHLGDARFVERLRTYLEIGPQLRGRLHDLDYVDLRFDDRVYVHPHASARATAKAGGHD